MIDDNKLSNVMRYCPKCGAAAMRFVGLKLVRCDRCGFELYLNTAAAVAALITDDRGRLLVVVRAEEPEKGKWDLPGGFVDPGEPAEEAIRREVKEELGLEVTTARFLCSYPNTYRYGSMRYATVDLGFVCKVADLATTQIAEDEVAQMLFVRPEEIDLSRFAFASLAKMVDRYRNEPSPPPF